MIAALYVETDGCYFNEYGIDPWDKAACCDCGLVHRMDFRIHKGRAQFRAWRDNRTTANYRRTT